jgi:PKD repeat protein
VITYTIDVFRDSPFQVAYQLVSINVVPVLGFTSAPTADMIITPIDGLTFKFTPTGNNVQSLLWDFGDGNTSSEWAPVHTYAEPGEYAVKQTAFNPLGFDTAIQTLSVGDIIEKIDDFWQPWYIYVIGLILGFLILLCIASRMKRRA